MVFKPYAGVSTAVLVFTKTGAGGTENVWFYDMKADGFSLDDKRTEIADNDIPDIIARFHNLEQEADRQRTEQSFFVPRQEIADNDYDLSINKYKKTEYVPVEYPSTTEIMADLHELEWRSPQGWQNWRGCCNGEIGRYLPNFSQAELLVKVTLITLVNNTLDYHYCVNW